MLALLYLAAMTYFGDRVSRSFYRFTSIQHRLATSFLVGLLLSTLVTYLGAVAFARMAQPLLMGNLVFLIVFVVAVYKLRRHPSSSLSSLRPRPDGSERWDWICVAGFFIFACWLIFATLSFKDGSFQIAFKAWSDFGANLSLSQSFALGHNFPAEHPFSRANQSSITFSSGFRQRTLSFLVLIWFGASICSAYCRYLHC